MGLEYFTPVTGSFGGGLIGLSAALLLLLSGEILGSSGIASSVVLEPTKHLTDPRHAWKLVFMSTFLLFSNVVLAKYYTDDVRLGSDPSIPVVSSWGYLLGGLFVGFGTRLSNGCTTGHGICGMARLSLRSITAVCTFMLSAFAISMVISPDNKAFSKGTAFLRTDTVPEFFNRWLGFGCSFLFVIPTFFAMYNLWKKEQNRRSSVVMLEKEASQFFPTVKLCDLLDNKKQGSSTFQESKTKQLDYGATTSSKTNMEICDDVESPAQATCQATGNQKKETATDASSDDCDNDKKLEELQTKFRESQKPLSDGKIAPAALAACVFALGLAISEMVLPSKVLGFLALYTLTDGSYDPTLITVMVGGSVISFLSYQFVEGWGIIKNPWARHCPFTASEFCVPTNKTIDWKLIFGAFCFGVGWATAGLCPGPATFLAASGTKPVLAFWWPFYYIGAFAAKKLQAYTS